MCLETFLVALQVPSRFNSRWTLLSLSPSLCVQTVSLPFFWIIWVLFQLFVCLFLLSSARSSLSIYAGVLDFLHVGMGCSELGGRHPCKSGSSPGPLFSLGWSPLGFFCADPEQSCSLEVQGLLLGCHLLSLLAIVQSSPRLFGQPVGKDAFAWLA